MGDGDGRCKWVRAKGRNIIGMGCGHRGRGNRMQALVARKVG